MKFLCDQCKAKYQIDDAKVAGKTVRMKCRKCGHVIEIRAAVTESSQPTKERSVSLGQQPGIAAPPPRRNAPPTRPSTAPNALSSAFQKNVASDPPLGSGAGASQPPAADPAADDEWYVAINGVPVGPIGMSELRRKAASGLVTETSLAWREGLEEWRVVRAIPELASLLREATGSLRPSAATRSSVRPPAPRDPGPSLRPSKPPPRNNVIPLRGSGGGASVSSPAAASMGAASAAAQLEDLHAADPFAAPSAPFAAAADPFAIPAPAAVPAPVFAAAQPAPAFAPAPAAGRASSHSIAPLAPAKKPTPWGPIAMVAAAIAFGAAGGLAFFINRNQQVVTVPGPVQTIIVQVPGAPAAGTASPVTDPVASASASAKGAAGAVAAGPKATASATATSGGAANLAGLLGGGPAGPSGGGGGGGGGGSSLTQQDIENTVRNYQPGVKRRCWDSAPQTSSVNVMASVTVGGDGGVKSVSASGNDPTIARCIETQIRGWHFPPTGGTSQFNVPFKFVRQ